METAEKTGINLRTLLDVSIAIAMREFDLSNYQDRRKLIDYIESRIIASDWLSVYNNTPFYKKIDVSDSTKTEIEKTQMEWEKNFNF
jgi:hypothetical protein